MALFNVPKRNEKSDDLSLAKKTKSAQKRASVRGGNSLLDRIATIKALVESNLGKYKEEYALIQDKIGLSAYIDSCIKNGVVAIDTETTGLDPILDDIVGVGLYTPNNKSVYIPINHVSYVTGAKADNQLPADVVSDELARLFESGIEVVMFNAKFDIRVLRNQLNLKKAYCTWDCYLAARLMNENEAVNKLKPLHNKYVMDGQEDAFSFGDLFDGISFALIPITTAYLYAARDPIITYEFYEFQKKFMYYEEDCSHDDRNGMNGVAWLFFNIEMPCVSVVADMEDTGVLFDFEYNEKLKDKYHKLLDEKEKQFHEVCADYEDEIQAYRRKEGVSCKLGNPINIKSAPQLAILLYDILGCDLPKDGKRSTKEEVLASIDHPVARAILDHREFSTIVSTFIDKLPECVNPKDGRIHCSFNQYGAKTGRFSSSEPNLQNIPSHNKDIRPMFKATDGYVFMSSDYGQQEPRIMAQLCGDEKMIQAYKEGKDLYAEIAALSFNTTYENCLEFRPDGTTNPEGKNRRSQAKSILLGVLYGRGVPSIAEQLGTTTKKAQAIKDSVFKGFPAIPKFEEDSLDMAYELGYVTTLWGRKRRLPDLQLPEYEFRWKDGAKPSDDLLNFEQSEEESNEVPLELQEKYTRLLRNCKFGQKRKVFERANKEDGIWIVDNGGKIAEAQRQCVNSRIQGSAADMSKLAMILVNKDERLKELGFRLLIPVHDELIGECPIENAKECKERFAQLMSDAAKSRMVIPVPCDVELSDAWYGKKLDGSSASDRESKTSHAMDKELRNGNK